jgi:hypothetical protein
VILFHAIIVSCFAFNAVCVAVDIGLLASLVLSTFHNQTSVLLIVILMFLLLVALTEKSSTFVQFF